jgi:outer membrane protein assembly factor BamB
LVTSKPAIFTEIDGNIWIGCEDGSILVLDPNTFQPKVRIRLNSNIKTK